MNASSSSHAQWSSSQANMHASKIQIWCGLQGSSGLACCQHSVHEAQCQVSKIISNIIGTEGCGISLHGHKSWAQRCGYTPSSQESRCLECTQLLPGASKQSSIPGNEGKIAQPPHLEGAVHSLHGVLKHIALLLATSAGAVAVKCECLALQVHLLQLALVAPGRVLDSQVDVGGVAARGVREDTGGGVAQGLQAQLLSLHATPAFRGAQI
eukprot:1148766-Pelagomonas_calceolata.AAC.4